MAMVRTGCCKLCSWALLILIAGAGLACEKKAAPERPPGLAPSGPAPPATPPPAPPPPAPPPAAKEEVETVPAAPDPKSTVGGTIVLPAARRKDVAKTDTVFIIARRAGGPPGPASMMAVQKHAVSDFPMRFSLSGRDSMMPGTPFEGTVNITVRLDKDGDAMTRRKGDLLGQANAVKVGTLDVVIPLDTVLAEDQTLGPPPGGARPPGMPPGHP